MIQLVCICNCHYLSVHTHLYGCGATKLTLCTPNTPLHHWYTYLLGVKPVC